MKDLVPVKFNILVTVIFLGFILLFTNGCKGSQSDEGNTTDQPNLQAASAQSRLRRDSTPPQSPSMTAGAPNGTNRLINEKSPYLLQHARNPVDWFPWGEEAFRMAAKLDKPILLSIGYSTCHWCHVMEEESFSDLEVAKVLNDVFISIKVDREERPDIDNVYMQVCQMMASSCGWPLNIIMTPDKKPFFAATYIPKESRFGRMGLIELANKVKDLWANRRDDLLQSADRTMAAITQNAQPTPGGELGEKTLHAAYSRLSNQFDDKYGGFRSAPKFPTPHVLLFLLRYYNRTGEKKALEMVEKTLEAMRLGGIYDHVGFGFHRYSTDAKWLVPHFEKMLYDQAMLAMAYVEAYQVTGKREYKDTAREIFTYVLRDMTSPEGGFYSAEDADSDGAEGKFYVWSKQEIIDVLGEKEGQWLINTFNVKSGGNFSGAEVPKANILHLKEPLGSGFSLSDCQKRFENDRVKLFTVREKRIHPFKDDKILTDWNGLMITALAKGGQAFNDPRYTAAAKKAADFLLDKMRDPQGRLLHRYRGGDAAIAAYADDFAFFTMGLIDLYEATFDVKYLEAAIELNDYMLDHFWDKKLGGLFFTSDVAELVLTRSKDIYDGAIPSGNSVAAYNLMRLGRITANTNYEEKAAQIGRAFSRMIEQSPTSYAQMMVAVNFWVGPSYEVVISGDPESKDTLEMINALRGQFIPNKVVIFRPDGEAPKITAIAKYTENQRPVKGKATAYVCLNYQCRAPTNSIKEMLSAFEIRR